jgi:hypothetical protein
VRCHRHNDVIDDVIISSLDHVTISSAITSVHVSLVLWKLRKVNSSLLSKVSNLDVLLQTDLFSFFEHTVVFIQQHK